MKKRLLIVFAGILVASFSKAQCTPDAALAGESFGLWPDSLATVYTSPGGGGHTRVVDLVTFTDTVVEVNIGPVPTEVTIYVDAFKILDVRNADSFEYGTNIDPTDPSVNDTVAANDPAYAPWGMWFNEGDVPNQTSVQGCVYVSGSEAAWDSVAALANLAGGEGAVQLEIDVDVRVAETDPDVSAIIQNGSWLSTVPPSVGGGAITVDNYWLVAKQSGTGVVEVDKDRFMLVSNYPNPFTGFTTINFNAPVEMTDLDFNVYTIPGNIVYSENVKAVKGMNQIHFDGSQLSSGLYIYTLSDGVNTLTRKMNVK